jgi:hypothetical protein
MEAGDVKVPQQEPKKNTTTNLRRIFILGKIAQIIKN